jgi:hypothetical protein
MINSILNVQMILIKDRSREQVHMGNGSRGGGDGWPSAAESFLSFLTTLLFLG